MASYALWKVVFDRAVALSLLVACSPLLAVAHVAVRVTMGPPVYFRQQRLGLNGAPFEILKFRTMVVDAETLGGGYLPSELQLVPPVGKLLRRFSVDELPQLLNVLKGDMSLVGPRPAPMTHQSRYTPQQAVRLVVRPGLTGLAQVEARNMLPWSKRIELDVRYVETLSFRKDIRLLLRTVPKALSGAAIAYDQTSAEVDDLMEAPRKEAQ